MMGNSGVYSIAIGANTMSNKNNRYHRRPWSIAIGSYAMQSGTDGSESPQNVFIGQGGINSRSSNSVIIDNYSNRNFNSTDTVNIGYKTSTITKETVAIGHEAGATNFAVALGSYAGYSTGNYNNVAIGYYAVYTGGSASFLTGIGSYSAYRLNSGENAVYIGAKSGYNTTTTTTCNSAYSVNIGSYVGANGCSGVKSVSVGDYAGFGYDYKNVVPVLIGSGAGRAAGTSNSAAIGSNNVSYPVIIGMNAFLRASNGATNPPDVAIGTASTAGGNNTDLAGSVFIGPYTAQNSYEIKNSVCIGHRACDNSKGLNVVRMEPYGYYSKDLGKYSSILGVPSMVSALDSTNKSKFTGDNYANMLITPAVTYYDVENSSILFYSNMIYGPSNSFMSFSDKRLKENIRSAKYGLNDIRKINIYEYNLKDESIKKRQIGVIAQEMKEAIPEGVKQLPSGYYTVNADWLIFPMVNAIKELDRTFVSLKSDLTGYFNEYVILVSRVNNLEKEVKKLERENKSLTREVNIAYKKAKTAERRQ